MIRLLSKGFEKDPRSSQHGATQKLSILIIFTCCFIVLVAVLAWFALGRVKIKIQADMGDALEQEDPFACNGRTPKHRRATPQRDETLYDL